MGNVGKHKQYINFSLRAALEKISRLIKSKYRKKKKQLYYFYEVIFSVLVQSKFFIDASSCGLNSFGQFLLIYSLIPQYVNMMSVNIQMPFILLIKRIAMKK